MSDELTSVVRTTITFTHTYAGHVNVAKALQAAGLEFEMPVTRPNEVRVVLHPNVPTADVEPKAAKVIASALQAMGVTVNIATSAN